MVPVKTRRQFPRIDEIFSRYSLSVAATWPSFTPDTVIITSERPAYSGAPQPRRQSASPAIGLDDGLD